MERINIELGHTIEEWNEKYNNIVHSLWDYPLEDVLGGVIKADSDQVFWLIDKRLYETEEPKSNQVYLVGVETKFDVDGNNFAVNGVFKSKESALKKLEEIKAEAKNTYGEYMFEDLDETDFTFRTEDWSEYVILKIIEQDLK